MSEFQPETLISTNRNLIKAREYLLDRLPGHKDAGGIWQWGYRKTDRDDLPLISIVTVVKNSVSTMRETLESVFQQSYDNLELVVIDGGSDDGTLEILRENERRIDCWVSSPDRGIYDAMNKGLDLAHGRYIHFLNSDDHFTFSRSVQIVMDAFQANKCRYIHTNVLMLNDQKGFGWVRHSNVSRYYYLFKGMPQQAFFYEKMLFDEFGKFDLQYPVVADLDFLLRMMIKYHVKGKYVNIPAVVFHTGGISGDMAGKKTQREQVLQKHFPGWVFWLLRNPLFEYLLTRNEFRGKKKNFMERLLG